MGKGKPRSKNISDEVIDQSSSVISTTGQAAGAFGTAQNLINLVGCSNVELDGVDQAAAVKVNFSALQTAMKNTNISAKMKSVTDQSLEATAQALGITKPPLIENMKKINSEQSLVESFLL